MRRASGLALVFMAMVGIWGCGPQGAKLQKSVVPPDRTLFETGSEYLKKSQYIKARLAFQTLINTYPDSDLSADSYIAMGDSFYEEGGTENLLQAEDTYKNFIIFFPTNPRAVDAQMKIVSANMKMMRAPDRDPSYSYKAQAALQQLLDKFPDSDYIPIAREYMKEVQENLAQGNYGIAKFYSERGNIFGAQSRYQEIVENYRDFTLFDETLLRLGELSETAKNPDQAASYYARIAQEFPDSKYLDEAKSRLTKMGKSVPAVDAKLAAQHQPRIKPDEGFSPLRPFISFAEALGFKGPPDRYEEAKRSVESRKAEALAAQAAKPADGAAATGASIQIETILRKDASGRTQETTILGGGAGTTAGPRAAKPPDKNSSKKKKSTPKQN